MYVQVHLFLQSLQESASGTSWSLTGSWIKASFVTWNLISLIETWFKLCFSPHIKAWRGHSFASKKEICWGSWSGLLTIATICTFPHQKWHEQKNCKKTLLKPFFSMQVTQFLNSSTLSEERLTICVLFFCGEQKSGGKLSFDFGSYSGNSLG